MTVEPIKILLVEDNPGDARLLRETLGEAVSTQFELTHVQQLSEARIGLREERYDVVLLDLGLPDSHGIDTLILARAQAQGVPIVVLTGFDDEALAVKAVQEGAQDYLLKGQVDSNSLVRSIRYAIERKRAQAALVEEAFAVAKAEELQRSRQRIIETQESTILDIAAYLHGRVQGRLLALKGRLQELLRAATHSPETAQLLGDVVYSMDQVIQQELNALSSQLYPSIVSRGLVPALQSLGDQFQADVAIEMELDEGLVRRESADRNLVPEQVRLAAYRTAEEALTNVVKHAKASRVTVRLDLSSEGWLRLTVRDNGQGFDAKGTSGGLGMAAMQDYAKAVGGECVVRSTPDNGAEVTATLPLARSSAERQKDPLVRDKGQRALFKEPSNEKAEVVLPPLPE